MIMVEIDLLKVDIHGGKMITVEIILEGSTGRYLSNGVEHQAEQEMVDLLGTIRVPLLLLKHATLLGEAQAALMGIAMAKNLRLDVILEGDSRMLVDELNGLQTNKGVAAQVMHKIREELFVFNSVRVEWASRSCNTVADRLFFITDVLESNK